MQSHGCPEGVPENVSLSTWFLTHTPLFSLCKVWCAFSNMIHIEQVHINGEFHRFFYT